MGNEKAIEIEFYNDKIIIGTNEGSIFFYELKRDNEFELIGHVRANFSKIKDILYSSNFVYSLAEDGTLSIIPVATFDNEVVVNRMQIPVNIALQKGNWGNAIEEFNYNDVEYFVTADQLGNLVYWDLNLENNFNEIRRIFNDRFAQ